MIPTSVKRFSWALALSLLVHLIATFGTRFTLPEYHPDPVMEATIRTPPPPPPVIKKTKPRPKPAERKPPPPTDSSPTLEHAPHAIPEQAPVETPEPPAPPEPAESPAAEEAPITLPEHAEIRYTLHKGRDGFVVGKVNHSWKREGSRYAINQVAEASGIVSLFYSGRHVQISQGSITANGMQPESYWVQRGQSADKTDSAKFDWQAGYLTYGTGSDTRTVNLPAGTQDLLSFLYQLAFSPPLEGNNTRLHITTGRKLGAYEYQSRGEESIETPMGPIKALHIAQLSQSGEENTEIWLATEYYYFPLKIRFTDKQGSVMEQTAAAIEIK